MEGEGEKDYSNGRVLVAEKREIEIKNKQKRGFDGDFWVRVWRRRKKRERGVEEIGRKKGEEVSTDETMYFSQ